MRCFTRWIVMVFCLATAHLGASATFRGEVVDAQTGERLAARIYLQDQFGRWLGVQAAAAPGNAVFYGRTNWMNPHSVEVHTAVSAHPFQADLSPGTDHLTVERGHEYHLLERQMKVGDASEPVRLELRRWINMASRGWFSGDTHVHRTLEELPTVMLAEDLNVAFPLVYWVTRAYASPSAGDKSLGGRIPTELVKVDRTHVIWPRNTEWEIFTVDGKNHTLGAVFALGHRSAFTLGAPPVGPIAAQARREGALLDLDKHNWPWSMALIPIMAVDLYELANNHMWRTEFAFTNWAGAAPSWMDLPGQDPDGGESAWINYTWQNYYTLLNCGFRLRPTAGTANGVHPVPLGFGRVYVRLEDEFNYQGWLRGLNAGRSFITTGPMLLAEFNGRDPGAIFSGTEPQRVTVSGKVFSQQEMDRIELVKNGQVVERFTVQDQPTPEGARVTSFEQAVEFQRSGWLAVRAWEKRPGGRRRFAHTAPVYVDIEGRPLIPRREEAEFLAQSVGEELERSRNVLSEEALKEYQRALQRYQEIVLGAE